MGDGITIVVCLRVCSHSNMTQFDARIDINFKPSIPRPSAERQILTVSKHGSKRQAERLSYAFTNGHVHRDRAEADSIHL